MLAAAGQLNLNIEQRAKQGHHKQSVQLYSRDDVWPSLFLQRDILIEIGSGWRTHHHRRIPTQALHPMKTFMYPRYIHPFLFSTRSLISFMLHLKSAQVPRPDLVSKFETNVSKLLVGHPLLEPQLTLLIPYRQAHVCAKEKHA